jgi:hypothetical protein
MVFFSKIRSNAGNIDDILVDATAEISNETVSGSWTRLAETAIRKKKTHEAQGHAQIPSSSIVESKELVGSIMSQMGGIVNVSSFLGPSVMAACFGVDTALNIVPVVVCVNFEETAPNETTLNIAGYSKNEKAAQKAIERFKIRLAGDELEESFTKNNNLVWIAAFVPLISIVLDLLLGGGMQITGMVFAFNCAILGFDHMRLKMSGIDVTALNGWMCVLIPVYLYKRAKLLGHKLSYFVTWIVFFIISLF